MSFGALLLGALVASQTLYSKDGKAAKAAASSLVALPLNQEGLEWVHILADGWATPLTGFMKEDQYLQCLHFQTIDSKDGSVPMPVPIVLPVTKADFTAAEGKTEVALKAPNGDLIAVLRNLEWFDHRWEERATRTFGIQADKKHPYIEKIFEGGEKLVGGDLEVFDKIIYNDGLDKYRLSPEELKAEFKKLGADAVFAFQLRNPVHNGHALLMQDTAKRLKEQGFKKPVLWLSPLGGWTKDDDVPLDVRMNQHHAIIKNGVFGDTEVVLAIFPSPMLYGGPREVQWHAYARWVGGSTHYIVGRDPAGMKHPTKNELQPSLGDDMYDMWHGQKMLGLNSFFKKKLDFLPFHFASYDTKAGKMAFFDPKRKADFTSISGTKMRKMAKEGTDPPPGFMDPEGWSILVKFYQSLEKEL